MEDVKREAADKLVGTIAGNLFEPYAIGFTDKNGLVHCGMETAGIIWPGVETAPDTVQYDIFEGVYLFEGKVAKENCTIGQISFWGCRIESDRLDKDFNLAPQQVRLSKMVTAEEALLRIERTPHRTLSYPKLGVESLDLHVGEQEVLAWTALCKKKSRRNRISTKSLERFRSDAIALFTSNGGEMPKGIEV